MEAAITSVLEEHLNRIQRSFQQLGFVQAGELADRHGALQLTFLKETDELARLVLLNEAVGTGEGDYHGSIDVVVQAGDRFDRRRVTASDTRTAFEREVTGEAIEAAAAVAESIRNGDLVESFALRQRQPVELRSFSSEADDEVESGSSCALDPEEVTPQLVMRLLAYATYALRRRWPKPRPDLLTPEELVTEAFTKVLEGKQRRQEGLPVNLFMARIIHGMVSHESARANHDDSVPIDDAASVEQESYADLSRARELANRYRRRIQEFARLTL